METGTGLGWGDGSKPTTLKVTTHTDEGIAVGAAYPTNQTKQGDSYTPPNGVAAVWHTCGVLIDPIKGTATYYIDSTQVAQHISPSATKPLYLLLDEWFGGPFNDGSPVDPVALSAAGLPFDIDYWRAYTQDIPQPP